MTAAQPMLPLARRARLCELVRAERHAAFLRRWQREHAADRTPRRLVYEAAHGSIEASAMLDALGIEWRAQAPRELRSYSWASVYDALRRAGLLNRRVAEHKRGPNLPSPTPQPQPAPEPSPIAAAPAPVHDVPRLYPAPEPSERDHLLSVIERLLPRATTGRLARAVAALAEE
ncbi:MAG: hypothetical protein ABFD84_12675 [Candidatus Polarisedimenticolia bacterium]